MALHALGVGAVERQAGEELGRHAAAPAGVVGRADAAGAARLRAPQRPEQLRLPPHAGEPARIAHIAGQERVVDGERAGVHVADRIDEAHDPPGAAQVQPRQRLPVARQVEERVAGEHAFAVGQQPVVQLPLLGGGGVQLVPHVGAPARRPQPGEPQLGAVAVGDRLEGVELGDVVPGADDRQLEPGEAGGGQVLHRLHGGGERPLAPHGVVDVGGGAVERDLHVDVVAGGQPGGHIGGDPYAVGRELHADVMGGGVVDQLPEVGPDGRLAAADVHVEHLHALELVDDRLRFGGGELGRVAAPGARQAVPAGQVAGVGQLPRQADGRVEATGEVLDQRDGHAHPARSRSMSVSASRASARS